LAAWRSGNTSSQIIEVVRQSCSTAGSVNIWMGDCPQYEAKPTMSTQPSTLRG